MSPAWRWVIAVFVIGRLGLTVWSLLVAQLMPLVVKDLNLFGAPLLATFDVASSERHVYSLDVLGSILNFRPAGYGLVSDLQTGSVWSLSDGRALSGPYAGRALQQSVYSSEDIFPYRGVQPETNPLIALWQRFDTNWYIAIAERGYGADGSTVYFPLYPALIRLAMAWLSPMPAAILISNAALVGLLYLLYQLSNNLAGEAAAKRTLAYLVLFPTAFFFYAAYSESLFLLFALGSMYSGQKGRWGFAGLLGALAALTRLQGALILPPLAYIFWRERRMVAAALASTLQRAAWLALIPAGTAFFLLLTNFSLLGDYEAHLHAQFVWPWQNATAALSSIIVGSASLVDVLNLLVVLWLALMLVRVLRSYPLEYGLFGLGMFLAPLFRMTNGQPLVSMSRYALVVFPVFVLCGDLGARPWVNRAIVYLSLPLTLYLSAQFVLWGWVA